MIKEEQATSTASAGRERLVPKDWLPLLAVIPIAISVALAVMALERRYLDDLADRLQSRLNHSHAAMQMLTVSRKATVSSWAQS